MSDIACFSLQQSKQQHEPLAWRWVETDTTEMFLLDLLVEHCHFPVVAASRMAET